MPRRGQSLAEGRPDPPRAIVCTISIAYLQLSPDTGYLSTRVANVRGDEASPSGWRRAMIIREHGTADIATPTGPMRLNVFQPAAPGRYPGLVLYSEIYQITGPVRRMA